MKEERTNNLLCKERLSCMNNEKYVFLDIVQEGRKNEYLVYIYIY